MLLDSPRTLADFHAVWWAYENGAPRVPGPIGVVRQVLRSMDWTWVTPDLISRPELPNLSVIQGPAGWWHHQIRDGLRKALWSKVAERRADCNGLHETSGVDREATLHTLQSNATAPLDKGLLRSIVSGSVRLGERLCKAGLWHSPVCPFCEMEDESVRHCFWTCPAWDHLRLDPDLPDYHERQALPGCTLDCGIFMQSHEETFFEHQLQPAPHIARAVAFANPEDLQCETWSGDSVVVWTDGACAGNQFRSLRRAGCGAFFGSGHTGNLSFALPGPEQTNQRAELAACLAVLECEPRRLEIRTDSKYVIDGARNPDRRGDNADLWRVFHETLAARGEGYTCFVKVKGHAKDHHVKSGLVLPIDKFGNDGADKLAVQGAKLHAVPAPVLAVKQRRLTQAKATHRMMLKVLSARRIAEHDLGLASQQENDECDHGDDPWNSHVTLFIAHPRSGEG